MWTRLGALGAVLLLALGTTACGSDAEPSSKPAPPSAPSPTAPPGLDLTEPDPPKDVAKTSQSAEEFARYFARLAHYAIRIRDITPVAALARDQAACSSCRQFNAYIQGLKKDKLWEASENVELGRLEVRPTGASTYAVSGPAVYPRISFVDLKGDEQAKQVVSNYAYAAYLAWDSHRDRWQVDDYTLLNKGKK